MNFMEQPTRRDLSDRGSDRDYRGRPHEARKWPIHYDSVGLLAIMVDVATIVLVSVFCGLYHLQGLETSSAIGKSLGSAILVSALFISLMKIRGMYRPTELLDLRNQIRTVLLVWTSVFLLLAGAVFALKIGHEISRGTSMLFALFGLIALIMDRTILRDLVATGLAGRRFSGRNIVLITDHSQTGANLLHTLTGLGFSVEGYFMFPPEVDAHGRERLVAKVIEHIRGSN